MSNDTNQVDYGNHYNPEDYTFELKLRFRNEDAARTFMSGLSDAWGENEVDIHYPWRQGVKFHETDNYCLDVRDCNDPDVWVGVPEETNEV